MLNKRIFIHIVIHISAWLVFLSLPNILFDLPFTRYFISRQLWFWFISIAFFYLNYFILIPYLFLKKKYVSYLLSILATITIFFTLNAFAMKDFHNGNPQRMNLRDLHPQKGMHKTVPFDRGFRSRQGLGGVYLFLLLGATGMAIRIIQEWIKTEKAHQDFSNKKLAAELSTLKAQVNPHFLFNSLNSIYSLSLKKSDKAPEIILKLSELLRYMLYESSLDFVGLDTEIKHLEEYIELQKIRITNQKIRYKFSGVASNLQIQPLLLMPLVENIFKHGIHSGSDNEIDISVSVQNNILVFNSSNPFNDLKTTPQGGIGLSNIRRRLELSYPDKFELSFEKKSGKFFTFLTLKLY